MKNASIKVKLTLATFPSLIILIASVIMMFISVNSTVTQCKKMYHDTLYQVNSNLLNGDRDLYQAMQASTMLYNMVASGSTQLTDDIRKETIETYNENIEQAKERVDKAAEIAKSNDTLNNEKGESGKSFAENAEAFDKAFEEWKALYDLSGGKIPESQFVAYSQKFDVVRDYISEMTDITERWAEIDSENLQSSINTTMIIIIVVFAVIAIAMTIFVLYVTKLIANSVRTVSDRLVKLSHYDLSDEPIKVDSKDELGVMKKALNDTEDALEHIVGILRHTSSGLVTASGTVSKGTDATGTGIDNVSSAADELANASTSMAQDVSDISMNMTELSSIMERSESSAKALSEASNEINSVTDRGNSVVEQLAGINEKSYVEFNAIFDAIDDIKKSGEKISEASDLILNIADQTNLLSLNASIEAARAGEAGKGFAVVADEIRKLSDESKDNVDTINAILSELTTATSNASQKADVVKEFVQKQNDAVGETKESFEAIVSSVESVEEAIGELERVNEELNVKSKEIDESVSNLSALSQENAATSEELSATAITVQNSVADLKVTQGDVASSSGEISEIVGRFIIADGHLTDAAPGQNPDDANQPEEAPTEEVTEE
ncbi:MAG: hypothetical protein K5644_08540 [Lachnospiraceae bacterium]|nr:hypothetical protein [Lachnospiraceae bacterium]